MTIAPKAPVLVLGSLAPTETLQLNCVDNRTGQPQSASWWLETPDYGTIDSTGRFKPSGKRAGVVNVFCSVGEHVTVTPVEISIRIIENSDGLPQAWLDALRASPVGSDPGWNILYPYDQTVFPLGIRAPEVHLTKGDSNGNSYRLHAIAPGIEYEKFFAGSPDPTRIQWDQDVWTALCRAAAGSGIELRITKESAGKIYGPIHRTLRIAAGELHGVIYYNTYDSPLAGQQGAVMRIKGNAATPDVLIGGCTVCHSISSDGSTAAAADHRTDWTSAGVFDLTGGSIDPPLAWAEPERGAFPALYPKKGEVFVVNGAPGTSAPPNTPGTAGPYPSELRTKDGILVPESGIEAYYAQSPAFSHDGSLLAFTDRTPSPPYPSVLAMVRYDGAARKFGNYEALGIPPSGYHYSWPSFSPDNHIIVFQMGAGADLATWNGNTGRLQAVDPVTKQIVDLGMLNGDEHTPAGDRDRNKNYEPTFAPVASGGYFWVMFTSRRTYGNRLTGSEAGTKRLWVAAIDIHAPPGVDPSHPAFYLPGQELDSGNSRGFWALDPCKEQGSSCASGDECCQGFCNATPNGDAYVCGPADGNCSSEFELCSVDADCCGPNHECVAGRCAVTPPK